MRIICGTDFSPLAAAAANVAGAWSRRCGGEMHLIHACSEMPPGDSGARAAAALEAEARRLSEAGIPLAAAVLIPGAPDEVLVSEAARREADLLVLGAVGHRLTHRVLLGSTAARVAGRAKIPVLVVRGAEPFDAWLRGGHLLRVLTGFERGDSARGAVRWAASLDRLRPISHTVLEMVVPGEENRRLGSVGPGMGLELGKEVERTLLAELAQAVAPLTDSMPAGIEVRAAMGRRDVHLTLLADEFKADLLVVGSHQRPGYLRWWHGSVSSGALHAATMSVAVVPFLPPDSTA